MSRFDVVVIGGGSAGIASAIRSAELGGKVCIVEKNILGGSSLRQGEFFVRYLLADLQRIQKAGQELPSFPEWLVTTRKTSKQISDQLKQRLKQYEITLVDGDGSIVDATHIEVKSNTGKEILETWNIILATGSIPTPLDVLPFDDESILPSDNILTLDDIPRSLLLVGDSPTTVELGLLFNRLGSRVFLLVKKPRLISDCDPELIEILESSLKKEKIKSLLNKTLSSVYRNETEFDITLDGGVRFSTHKVMLDTERSGLTSDLGLDRVQVDRGKNQEIFVDENQRTSQPNIFAAGSITGHRHWQDLSEEEGRVAASNALGKSTSLDTEQIPLRLHTEPPIMSLGTHSSEAHHKGYRGEEGRCDFSIHEGVSIIQSDSKGGFCKVVADRESRKIIGSQIAGPAAEELLALVQMAVRRGMTVKSLAQVPLGFGTPSRILLDAARQCLNKLGQNP